MSGMSGNRAIDRTPEISYPLLMSAAEALEKEILFNKEGEPSKVIISYEKFIEFIEAHGLDLSEEDLEGIREAEADQAAGNKDEFISHEELKRSLGLECTS